MYGKGILLIVAALVATLAAATVATGAPPEKRTMCTPDGETIKIPTHATGPKGATEGPCEETPPEETEAERICREQLHTGQLHPGTMIDATTCEYTFFGSQYVSFEPERIFIEGYFTYRKTWRDGEYPDSGVLVDVVPTTCSLQTDLVADPDGTPLPLDDPRCAWKF